MEKDENNSDAINRKAAGKLLLLHAELIKLRQEYTELLLRESVLNASLEQELLERKAQEQTIWRLANYDALTGLPNRAYMNKRLADETEKARQARTCGAVLHIDLDDLNLINDTFGYACGDAVIAEAGEYIAAAAGEEAVAARIGDDEFAVLLFNESHRERVEQIAGVIIKQLSRRYDSKIAISASIGIAFYPSDGETAEEILKKTALALLTAKRSGKNTWRFCEAGLQSGAYENMVLRRELREAVEQGGLSLQYQPIVDAADRRIVCFEALLRWTSPTYGAVPPSRFIPIAEESDTTIRAIGKWVLEQSCRFLHRLTAMGSSNIRIAVNVSPRQLAADDFVDLVLATINAESVSPSQLEIEITENVLVASLEDSTQKLSELCDAGVRLALDDFGTGYSSLTYLRNLPAGTLKIDKSFIDRIISDDRQLQFIRLIINMAHTLGLAVVAEGVETEEQAEKLVQCRCDYIQGYVFGRPVSEKTAVSLLLSQGKAK